VLFPGTGYPQASGIRDTRRINDRIAAYQKMDPAHLPVALGIVEPLHGVRSLEEIDRIKDQLHLAGIMWHHRFQGAPIDHNIMSTYLKRMVELKLLPFIHCYGGSDMEAIWRLVKLAEEFPQVTFLALDSMAAGRVQFNIFIAKKVPNILFDTSLMQGGHHDVEAFVHAVGSERLFFGSGLYSKPYGYEHTSLKDDIVAARISEQDRANIFSGNARRLLGL